MSKLVGIVNITPDSFSDGGKHDSCEKAYNYCQQLINDGADILDIGAESTRPGAKTLTAQEEWQRLEPVLGEIINLARKNNRIVSIDTRNSYCAEKSLEQGADWINDVSAMSDPKMLSVIKNTDAKIVLMHNLGVPADKNHTLPEHANAIEEIHIWAKVVLYNLQQAGIDQTRIIIDPGVGFGKTAKQSLDIIRNINCLNDLDCEIMVGHSRKSFFDLLTQKDFADRDQETLLASLFLSTNNVDYLRVHNVKLHKSNMDIYQHFLKKA